MKSPKELHERCLELLSERGVELNQLLNGFYFLTKICTRINEEECLLNVTSVLKKHEFKTPVIHGYRNG